MQPNFIASASTYIKNILYIYSKKQGDMLPTDYKYYQINYQIWNTTS